MRLNHDTITKLVIVLRWFDMVGRVNGWLSCSDVAGERTPQWKHCPPDKNVALSVAVVECVEVMGSGNLAENSSCFGNGYHITKQGMVEHAQ